MSVTTTSTETEPVLVEATLRAALSTSDRPPLDSSRPAALAFARRARPQVR